MKRNKKTFSWRKTADGKKQKMASFPMEELWDDIVQDLEPRKKGKGLLWLSMLALSLGIIGFATWSWYGSLSGTQKEIQAIDKKDQVLEEKDYKYYILDHYTFLKRPVIISDQNIFIGNSRSVIESAKQFLGHQ